MLDLLKYFGQKGQYTETALRALTLVSRLETSAAVMAGGVGGFKGRHIETATQNLPAVVPVLGNVPLRKSVASGTQ